MTFDATPVLAAVAGENGHDIPAFLLTLAAILVGAKLFGELAERIGQPAVLGELVAGVLLGSSALHLPDRLEEGDKFLGDRFGFE